MKYQLTRQAWEEIGNQAGWLKEAQVDQLQPLDGVQTAPDSQPKFKKKKKKKRKRCK
jgi:hypothetical protein